MKTVYIIGGAGYIGSRVVDKMFEERDRWDPVVLDLGLHGNCCDPWDVTTGNKALAPDGLRTDIPILYLAGAHESPFWNRLSSDEKFQWQQVGRKIMIDAPLALVERGHPLVYVSSMRALTHPHTYYGNLKRQAEIALFQKARIIRIGTVYGSLRGSHGPKRTITVPNNYLLRGELPDEHWKAYITPMRKVVSECLRGLEPEPREAYTTVVNAVAEDHPFDAVQLERFFDFRFVAADYPDKEEHPAYAFARHYNLPIA
jgi:nucleoside-diphosphate-sugar epimerase